MNRRVKELAGTLRVVEIYLQKHHMEEALHRAIATLEETAKTHEGADTEDIIRFAQQRAEVDMIDMNYLDGDST